MFYYLHGKLTLLLPLFSNSAFIRWIVRVYGRSHSVQYVRERKSNYKKQRSIAWISKGSEFVEDEMRR